MNNYLKTLISLLLALQVVPVSGADMLYKSNFGPDNTILSSTPTVLYEWAYQDITGINAKSGTLEEILPWGAESSRLQMIVGAPVTTATVSNYIFNEIQQVEGPDGSQVYALFQTLKVIPLGSSAQDPLVITRGGIPTTDTGDVYYTYWIKLQPDLVSQLSVSSGGWRVLNALKTVQPDGGDNGDTRIGTSIYLDSSTNTLFWNTQQDENALGTGPLDIKWQVQNKTVPVPAGEWFKYEVFWHRSTGSDGHYWAAVNGQPIVDHWGPNMGSYNMPINRVMLNELYTGGKTPAYQWTTDLEIWNGFPCGEGVSCFNKSKPPLDSTASSSPTGLIVTTSSSTTVNLAWNKSADNVSVTGYKIYRDGIEIGTSNVSNYIDTSVVAGTKYTYTAQAYDNAGNFSAVSEAVTTSTPLEDANLIITSHSFGNAVTINWSTNIPASGVIYYGKTADLGQFFPDTTLNTSHSVTIKWLSSQTEYYYKIRADLPTGTQFFSSLNTFTTPN